MSLPGLLVQALMAAGLPPVGGDVLVVVQKIVSKAEGRVVDLAEITPGEEARRVSGRRCRDHQ